MAFKPEDIDGLVASAPAAPKGQHSEDSVAALLGEDKAPGKAEAFVRGAGQGVTLGFGDEIAGLASALNPFDRGDSDIHYKHEADAAERYKSMRDSVRTGNKAADDAHGGYYLGGNVAGGALTSFAPGLGALNAGKGAGLAAIAGKGALTGAISGAGSSDADTVSGVAKDAAMGGAFGAGAGALGHGLTKIPAALGSISDSLAIKALKPTAAQLQKIKDLPGGKKAVVDVLNESGALKPLGGIAGLADRTEAAKTAIGGQVSKPLQMIDEALGRLSPDKAAGSRVNVGELAERASGLLDDMSHDPVAQKAVGGRLREVLQNMSAEAGADGSIPFQTAHAWRQSLDKELYGMKGMADPVSTRTKDLLHSFRGILNDELKTKVGEAADTLGVPELSTAFRKANDSYGAAKLASGIAEKSANTAENAKMFGVGDALASVAGHSLGHAVLGPLGPVSGVATFAAKKAWDKTGAQTGSVVLRKVSDMLARSPEALGQYAKPLANAAQKGQQTLAAHIYALQNSGNPEARLMLQKLAQEDDHKSPEGAIAWNP